MRKSGSITIFLSLILVCVGALICGLVESARTAGARYYLQTSSDSAIDSVFSAFDNKLWEKYRLILRDYESDEALIAEYDEYLRPYMENSGIYQLSEPNIELEDKQKITDEGGAWLENEISDYMRYKIAADLVMFADPQQMLDQIENAHAMSNISKEYSDYSKKASKMEKALKRLSENLAEQRLHYQQAQDAINSRSISTFSNHAEHLRNLNNRIPELIRNYTQKADALAEEYAQERERHAQEWETLSPENRAVLEERLSCFGTYVEEDGERRAEIEAIGGESARIGDIVDEAINMVPIIEDAEDEDQNIYDGEGNVIGTEDGSEGDAESEYAQLESLWQSFSISEMTAVHGIVDEEKSGLLETLLEVLGGDLLALVIPADRSVSTAAIDLTAMPSNASRTQRNEPGADILKTIFVNQYARDYFPDFVDKKEDNFAYELEYILSGQDTDRGNLSSAVLKILMIREAMNYMYIFTDSAKMSSARTLAYTISGGVPVLSQVMEFLVISAWVLAESVMDIRSLLAGEEVMLVKTADTWKLDLDSLFAIGRDKNVIKQKDARGTGATQEEAGAQGRDFMVYDMYLRILLFLETSANRNYRILDMIELNMKSVDPEFRAGNKIYSTKYKLTCLMNRVFSRLGISGDFYSELSDTAQMSVTSVKGY